MLQVYHAPASMNFIVPLSVHLTMKHSCPLNVELNGGIEMNGDRESTAWDKEYTPPAKALGKNLAHSFIITNDESRRWGREPESFSPGGNAKD